MLPLNGYQLIRQAALMCLGHAEAVADHAAENLQTGASTSDVNALRIASAAYSIIAVGAFQSFEAYLHFTRGWQDAFVELNSTLNSHKYTATSEQFLVFKDAINALKHGDGRSYRRLLASSALPFDVKAEGERYFDEGDVSEVVSLVNAGPAFVHACIRVMDDAYEAIVAIESVAAR